MKKRATYHHGDLKAAALDQAVQMLEADAQEVPSMRMLAQKLGVGHRALYNHYKDREALLAAIAARGFAMLADALKTATDQPSHLRTYIDFALDHPGLYSVMMDRPYRSFQDNAALWETVEKIIAVSMKALASDDETPDDRRRVVMRTWMLAHGGIALHKAGALQMRSDTSFTEEFMRIAST